MNNEFHELYLKKMRNELNGFSWVVEQKVGGMRLPPSLEDVEPVIQKYNIGLVVSLTEHPLQFKMDSFDVVNIHLPVIGFISKEWRTKLRQILECQR
jgi:hypothetical protein